MKAQPDSIVRVDTNDDYGGDAQRYVTRPEVEEDNGDIYEQKQKQK